jgi:hypothetical protein
LEAGIIAVLRKGLTMDDFKRISSNQWGTPNQGSTPEWSQGAEQGDKGISVAAIRAKDGERYIPGVDINGYIKGYLDDDASATEQGDEQAEEERVEKEARANQR